MRVTTFSQTNDQGSMTRRTVGPAVLAVLLVLSACGAPPTETASPTPPRTPTTASELGSSASTSTGDVSTSTDPAACGQVPVTAADLADAQFAFIGRVSAVADEVHPWTTDPENPDRQDEATATRWVTFDVERWYLNDWGLSFSVWMPEISVAVGQRLAVGGNAYFTQVAWFAGQSGEVEFCAPLEADATTVPEWDQLFGEARVPSSTVTPTTIVLPATKVFGEHVGPCEPTVLTNGDDDQSILVAGVACFLAEFEAGRPLVWDVRIPTVEGDPIVTRYEYDGTTMVITTDNSFDIFGSGGVLEETCSTVSSTNWLPDGIDCTTATGVGFVAASLDI